jgi:hypothetical protein
MQPGYGKGYICTKHCNKHEKTIATSTPNLGLIQAVFCNSYLYKQHTNKNKKTTATCTPNQHFMTVTSRRNKLISMKRSL